MVIHTQNHLFSNHKREALIKRGGSKGSKGLYTITKEEEWAFGKLVSKDGFGASVALQAKVTLSAIQSGFETIHLK